MTATIYCGSPAAGDFPVLRVLSEKVDVERGIHISDNRNERVRAALALVLHDNGIRANAAITAAVDDPSLAAAVHSTAAGDARHTVDAWDRRTVRASSCRATQERVRDGAATT